MSWIKKVPLSEIKEGALYFIGMNPGGSAQVWFWSQYLSGKETWSGKPGIAIRYKGGPALVAMMKENGEKYFAVEVPADADKRWRARKPPRRRWGAR